jgi:ATP phosphoribosyltransferase
MERRKIRLVLPTGRMHEAVLELLEAAGLSVARTEKDYRPLASDPRFEIKLMKAANVPALVELGKHDAGVTGLDWVRESAAEVEELMDTGLLPVRLVAAAPRGRDPFAAPGGRPLVVASEYERLTRDYMRGRAADWRYVRTHGATEVFPPEDADLIVDNTATGSALAANGLAVIDELFRSTTRFVASPRSLEEPCVREAVEDLCLLMRGALAARERVLLEMNVAAADLGRVVALLPAMKSPTVQPLYQRDGEQAFAVKAAVPRARVAELLPVLRRAGATDLLESALRRVVP